MGILDKLLAFFSRGTTGFNSLEIQVLRETMKLLGPISAEKMQRRIGQVALVQRLAGGEQVNSYCSSPPRKSRNASSP
ncbi:MAG: hypothetical protein ABIV06_13260 [Thermoanaerobaculia bacterium]